MDDKKNVDIIDLIQQGKMFSNLNRETCESLLKRFEKIAIKSGDILFSQGDPSDSLYILIEGSLIATLKTLEGNQKIVGVIEVGETVGEMGALSRQPRSLTVQATDECELLKLSKAELAGFFKEHPDSVYDIIDIIVSRSQTTIKLLTDKKIFKHSALIKGNDNTSFDIFLKNIKKFNQSNNILILDDEKVNLSKSIAMAEADNKILVFVLNEKNFFSLGTKIHHVGGFIVVVDSDKTYEFSKFTLKILNYSLISFLPQFELIVLHNDNVQEPTMTDRWLRLAKFTLHHHVKLNEITHYERLIRFFNHKPIALVIGGGGGRAWIAIGALKALNELKIPIDAIGGTSAGSLLAGFFAIQQEYEKLNLLIQTASGEMKNLFVLNNLTWPIISLTSGQKIHTMAHNFFNDKKIEDLWLSYFAVSCNLNIGKEMIHREGLLSDAIICSVSVPGLLPPMLIDGQIHFDGGLLNNFPVDVMRSILGNEAFIIGVSLSNAGEDTKRYNFPPVLPFRIGFLRKLRLAYREYKFPPFFSTFLNALLIGSSPKEKSNKLLTDVLINPNLTSVLTFDLSIKQREKLIELGYNETIKEIKNNMPSIIP